MFPGELFSVVEAAKERTARAERKASLQGDQDSRGKGTHCGYYQRAWLVPSLSALANRWQTTDIGQTPHPVVGSLLFDG
jgi:hypothetical protein